jgi:hypothetical protein
MLADMQPDRVNAHRQAPGLLDSTARKIRRLFARRLRLERKGLNIHIVLDKPVRATAAPQRPPAALDGDDPVTAELREIDRQLRLRLDRHALSRNVFDKLAIVERELKRHGYPALHVLPVELLHTALDQLAHVAGGRGGELVTLRAKMLDAILTRRSRAGDFTGNLALSTFDVPHKVQVRDAGESEFLRAQQELAR